MPMSEKEILFKEIEKNHKMISSRRLQKICKKSVAKKMKIRPLDTKYKVVSLEIWKKILKLSSVNEFKYVGQVRDCDDFAFTLRGEVPLNYTVNSISLVMDFSGGHAYNAIITYSEGNPNRLYLALIEPQNDRFVEVGEGTSSTEIYKLERGELIF